jgi:HlyD family secretion protein
VDIKREPPKKRGRNIAIGLGVAAILPVGLLISRLQPAPPTVERGSLWFGVVTRGPWKRQINAPGTLVPEHVRYVVATTSGRIEALPVLPGQQVTPANVLVELSNPDEQIELLQKQQSLNEAIANLAALKTQLKQQRLSQQSAVATLRLQYQKALRDAAVLDSLGVQRFVSTNEMRTGHETADDLKSRLGIEQERLNTMQSSETEQLRLQAQQIEGLRRILQNEKQRVASMRVTAPEAGQLQMLGNPVQLEVGQWVNAGTELARVVQPGRFKAVLRVPEAEAKDVAVGQRTSVDLHNNNTVAGHVIRKDPSSQTGTIAVEIALDGPVPAGTSSDLAVDATIEIERVNDALFVARPMSAQPGAVARVFRVAPDRGEANLVKVQFGAASVNSILVKAGLNVGDSVIISDMSQPDNANKVRIK